jgi:hypothetical protein
VRREQHLNGKQALQQLWSGGNQASVCLGLCAHGQRVVAPRVQVGQDGVFLGSHLAVFHTPRAARVLPNWRFEPTHNGRGSLFHVATPVPAVAVGSNYR